MTTPLPMLEKRRIEAEILGHVYQTLLDSHGVEVARATIAEAVRRSAIAQGQEMAHADGGATSLQTFIARQSLWQAGGALEFEVIARDASHYDFNITRCKYAEIYRAMGLGEIGALLSCQRDGTFCKGYDPKLRLTRTQTIMDGASHCDFRYIYSDEPVNTP